MITGKDSRYEDKKTEEILNSDAPLADKLKAIGKLVSVVLKVALNNRLNIVRIMEHLKIAKITSDIQKEAQTEEKK